MEKNDQNLSTRNWSFLQNWLFFPKHKLELMFSSIEPYAPRRCYLPSNFFPALCTTNTYSYHPLFLPANEEIASTCSETASQSALCSLPLLIFTCNSVKLLDSSVYFPTHPPRSSHISTVTCLRERELFCRQLVLIHSIGDVIPSTSIV